MSSQINMAIAAKDGQLSYNSIDEPQHVAGGWRAANQRGEMLLIRRVWFKALPASEDEGVHAGSPREVTKVEDIWVNPAWIDSVIYGNYPDATAKWRGEHDHIGS